MNTYDLFLKRNKEILSEAQANYKDIETALERCSDFKGNSAKGYNEGHYYYVVSYKTEILQYDTLDNKVVHFDDKKYSSTTSRIQNLIKKVFKDELAEYYKSEKLNEADENSLSALKEIADKAKNSAKGDPDAEKIAGIIGRIYVAVSTSKAKGVDALKNKLDKLADNVDIIVQAEKGAVDEVNPAFATVSSLAEKAFKLARKSIGLNESELEDELDKYAESAKVAFYKAKDAYNEIGGTDDAQENDVSLMGIADDLDIIMQKLESDRYDTDDISYELEDLKRTISDIEDDGGFDESLFIATERLSVAVSMYFDLKNEYDELNESSLDPNTHKVFLKNFEKAEKTYYKLEDNDDETPADSTLMDIVDDAKNLYDMVMTYGVSDSTSSDFDKLSSKLEGVEDDECNEKLLKLTKSMLLNLEEIITYYGGAVNEGILDNIKNLFNGKGVNILKQYRKIWKEVAEKASNLDTSINGISLKKLEDITDKESDLTKYKPFKEVYETIQYFAKNSKEILKSLDDMIKLYK